MTEFFGTVLKAVFSIKSSEDNSFFKSCIGRTFKYPEDPVARTLWKNLPVETHQVTQIIMLFYAQVLVILVWGFDAIFDDKIRCYSIDPALKARMILDSSSASTSSLVTPSPMWHTFGISSFGAFISHYNDIRYSIDLVQDFNYIRCLSLLRMQRLLRFKVWCVANYRAFNAEVRDCISGYFNCFPNQY